MFLTGCNGMAMLPSMTYKEIFFSLSASLSFIPGSLAPSGTFNMSFNISLTSADFTLTSEMLKLMNRTSCNSDGTFYFTSAKVWTNPLPSKSTQSVNRWEWGEVINWYLWRLRAIRSPGPFRIFIPQFSRGTRDGTSQIFLPTFTWCSNPYDAWCEGWEEYPGYL